MLFFLTSSAVLIEHSAHFRGNGWLEVNRSVLFNSSEQLETGVAVLFSTSHPDGLLIWYGQNKGEVYKGQDFISLAVVNGHLEFAFRLDGEESLLSDESKRVDDGTRHVAIIRRTGNQASLELDHFTVHGEARPTGTSKSFIPGHLFIGGAPNIATFTGQRYTQGFHGCVHTVEPLEGGGINFTYNSISGINVDKCPK